MRPTLKPRLLVLALAVGALAASASSPAQPNPSGVQGFWREPTGSVIHIDHCSPNGDATFCATLVFVRPDAPSRLDIHNPDATLHTRTLCGLRIGQGFHLASPSKAEGGTLYDPKSGKTYRGTMSSTSDRLNLRGYVGLPLFGRSETWTRTTPVEPCER